jgi:hypothetical protein
VTTDDGLLGSLGIHGPTDLRIPEYSKISTWLTSQLWHSYEVLRRNLEPALALSLGPPPFNHFKCGGFISRANIPIISRGLARDFKIR